MREKIVITTTSFGREDDAPLELLKEKGLEILINPYQRRLESREIIELCRDATGIIAGTENIDFSVMEKLKSLKVISRCGAGIENIDLEAVKKLKIKLYNTPDAPTIAVSELTVALILNLLRKVNRIDMAMHQERWEKIMGNLLFEKKVGIIGLGRIGRKVAELLGSFGSKLSYYDPFLKERIAGLMQLSLEKLLSDSDIVSIHAGTKDKIIGKNELQMMKKGAWLVNTARGEIVDADALYFALKNGHLSGAALDVFEKEPYRGKLNRLDNIILTSHIGSYAREARIKMEIEATKNLLKGLMEGD